MLRAQYSTVYTELLSHAKNTETTSFTVVVALSHSETSKVVLVVWE